METVERMHSDATTLFNIMSSIYTCINHQQILIHIFSILANLKLSDAILHAMDYIDTATTSILSSHLLPVEDIPEMLIHIKAELPSTMQLPVSSDDTLHFCRYLHTHILGVEE